MSDNTGKPSDLISVTGYHEIVKFFDEGARATAGMVIWTKNNEDIANCNIVSLSQAEKMIYTTAPATADPGKFYAGLKAAGDRCFLNMKLEKATIFFTSKLESNTFTNLQFTLPEKIFKVQRRQKQRFTILQGYVLRVSFQHPLDSKKELKQKIYDVSSNGLSFLIDRVDAPLFQTGKVLENLTFIIRTREFKFRAAVVHCKPIVENDQPSKSKVGVKFLDIDETAAAIIDGYVFEENRKFYSRFM